MGNSEGGDLFLVECNGRRHRVVEKEKESER